ncbi:hypothetical protein [Streptomyces sp. CB03238]|uniref:hypothetical protein n=1 Tax=Streptomyces sp. CB03238 TaxID=1907777 RepID=UPI000A0FDA9B|nr:hypothetical protein [Streptomyces sp. CB03238]ORT54204.1 hypothetical protein BKD26_36030 [Streptomyces sp. CB03238]
MDDLPKLEIEGGEWYLAVPPPAMPVPAAHLPPELHGKPAMASIPGVGVLHDMRVVGDAHRDSAGTWLHLVPELDFWRSQYESGQQMAPRRLPIDWVYIEHRLPYEPPSPGDPPPPPPPLAGDPRALLRRLSPRPDLPGGRMPVPARTVGHLHGRRIIQVTPLGFAWDLRAVSEPYEDANHDVVVRLTSVPEYYRWVLTGADPDPAPVNLYLLWTE